MADLSHVISALEAQFGEIATSEFRGQTRVTLASAQILEALRLLKDQFGFALLVDITCVDYLHYRDATDRFGLVYLLANMEDHSRLTVRTMLNDPDPTIPSATALWEGANWLEREVWDMFGIRFEGHPDLRRILLPEAFAAHPLRKDYPLQGRGERHNFPVLTRGEA